MTGLEDLRRCLSGADSSDPALRAAAELAATPPGGLIADSPTVRATRANPLTHYAAVWTIYHAKGASAAAAEAHASPGHIRDLPAAWAANLGFVLAVDNLLGGNGEGTAAATRSPKAIKLEEHLGVLSLPVLVNGHQGWFAFDTGAPTTVIAARFAVYAGLRQEPEAARQVSDGSGGMLRAIPAVADEMRVGDLVRRPAAATVMDLPLELELDGLLSPWDYARDMDVVVDAAAHSLRLGVTRLSSVTRKTTGTGHILPLRWIEGSPRTAVDAGDQSPVPTSALLDSGAVVNLLCADLAAALHRTVDAAAQGIGAGGAVVLHQTRALPMRTGNAEARCLPVMVKRCAADPSALVDEPAGIVLGMPWFLNAPIGFPARRHVALQLPQCA